MHRESSESSVVAQEPSSCYERAFTDHYRVLKDIGEGSFGKVVLARHLLTGLEVAVKVLPKTEENEPVLYERNWLMALEHQHVIQLFQVMETVHNMYLIMEHASGGQLRCRIPQAGGIPEDRVRRVFREMVHVVHYCHEKGIAHLDLKPENFVVDAKGHMKLIDFGLSMSFTPGQKLTGFRGTLLYSAPEIIQGKGFEGPPADVWSLGITLYFMLSGTRPFKRSTTEGLKKRILEASYSIPPHMSEEASDLIQQILTLDPKQRPTLEQIMRHPWLTQDEHSSPRRPSQPLPKRPDPDIMTIMLDMGYNPYKVWWSLANRQFDEAMGTYLILQHEKSQKPDCVLEAKPVRPRGRHQMAGSSPGPPADPPLVRPSKCNSEPALALPCEQQSEEAKLSRQKAACASAPVLPLHMKTSPSSRPPQKKPATQWRVYLRPKPRRGVAEGGSSAFAGQAHQRNRGWKGVTRRIVNCLQKLCCCMPCFHQRAAPMNPGHRRPRFRNRVAQADMPG
ncbi:sperm motility kinase 2B-like [Marmota flaviventris]|uniref:sperm motility kinase 2B-like n=1 Tax=Marmota flaviventris TaxID=93162 RepID=UPI003A875ED0